MNPIAKEANKLPLLLSDFFRHLHTHEKRTLKVFLCGQQEKDRYFDLRHNIKDFVNSRMGCGAFLGEDIPVLKIKPDVNHLSIEVQEAKNSDLVVVFLESPGTISEFTAFAQDHNINPKLLVFNDAKYRECKSFINRGPLKLLKSDQIVYYDSLDGKQLSSIITQLDYAIARGWFDTYCVMSDVRCHYPTLCVEDYMALFTVYATYPVRPVEFEVLLPILGRRNRFREIQHRLKENELVKMHERKLRPTVDLSTLKIPKGLIGDISRMRMRLLARNLDYSEKPVN